MHIVYLQGGLGNQLFQYAFLKALGDNSSCDTRWYYDIKCNAKGYPRIYQLAHYMTRLHFASQQNIQQFMQDTSPKHPSLLHRLFHMSPLNYDNRPYENHPLVFQQELLYQKQPSYYIGFFQSERYFKHIRSQLLQDITLKIALTQENTAMLSQIENTNSIAIHVRRRDYLVYQDVYPICDKAYYTKAIEHMLRHVASPHFFVFSDDIAWCRDNIHIDAPSTIVDINTALTGYYDLELMRHCKHNIIANSTFSWWGAWLNTNPNKIVIAPQQWIIGQPQHVDIVPEDWIQM